MRRSSWSSVRCSTTTATTPTRSPARFPPGEVARRVTDYVAGMTDRFCIRAFEALSVPVASSCAPGDSLHGRLPGSRPRRGRHGRARVVADRAASRGCQQLLRPVSVPRGAKRVVPRPSRREALPLLRLPGVRRPVRLRDGDRGARLQRRAGVARQALRSAAPDRGRGPRGRFASASAASGCTRCSAAPPRTTRATCRSRREAAPPASTCSRAGSGGDAAGVPGRVRPERLGPDPARLAKGGIHRRGADRGRARAALEADPGSVYDRFRERIMFPPPMRAAGCSGSARGRCATTSSRSTSTRPTGSCTTSEVCCSGSICARARGLQGRAHDPRRGVHGRARASPGRPDQRRRDHGDLAHRGAGGRSSTAWSGARACSSCVSTPTERGRRRCCVPRELAAGRKLGSGWYRSPREWTPPS